MYLLMSRPSRPSGPWPDNWRAVLTFLTRPDPEAEYVKRFRCNTMASGRWPRRVRLVASTLAPQRSQSQRSEPSRRSSDPNSAARASSRDTVSKSSASRTGTARWKNSSCERNVWPQSAQAKEDCSWPWKRLAMGLLDRGACRSACDPVTPSVSPASNNPPSTTSLSCSASPPLSSPKSTDRRGPFSSPRASSRAFKIKRKNS
mmetsp:Transcript_54943/g.117926  ORF Transcript_54943/g.117926 Transcript_54943/m.117926 type:complete len:203 (+) Transcript_54943:335-943(+)